MTPDGFRDWLARPPAGRRPLVMGVLNVTPDSFSDGGRFDTVERAVARALAMAAEGADLIDVGGESTRPGSLPVPPAEQVARIAPVLRALGDLARHGRLAVTLSVDTTRADVADAALEAGAHVVNDVSAGRDDPGLLPLVARRRVPVILMHMQGTPATMQLDPRYDDVTREVGAFLRERAVAATDAGVAESDVLLDPGIGFGKTVAHNLELLRRLGELAAGLGRPLVVGTSRKGFIGRVTGEQDPDRRLFGTAATVAWSVANGASVVRVHDVGPMVQVARMIGAIQTGGEGGAAPFSAPR
jgi:dihydropteroate synthase